uniref:Uncharacterized protein n=1 Tax=Rhipicephalus microplus TaxID=6941 RepID=A0A6G5AFG6_RHIMP
MLCCVTSVCKVNVQQMPLLIVFNCFKCRHLMIVWWFREVKAQISINPYNVTPVLCIVRISLKHCLTQKLHFVLPLFPLLMRVFFLLQGAFITPLLFFWICILFHFLYTLYLLLVISILVDNVLIFWCCLLSFLRCSMHKISKHIHKEPEPFTVPILVRSGLLKTKIKPSFFCASNCGTHL